MKDQEIIKNLNRIIIILKHQNVRNSTNTLMVEENDELIRSVKDAIVNLNKFTSIKEALNP